MSAKSRERKRFERKQRQKRHSGLRPAPPGSKPTSSRGPRDRPPGKTHYFAWHAHLPNGTTLTMEALVTETPEAADSLWLHLFLQRFVANYASKHGADKAHQLGIPFVFLALDAITQAHGPRMLWGNLNIESWLELATREGVCDAARPQMFHTLREFYVYLLQHDEVTQDECATVIMALDRALQEHVGGLRSTVAQC